MRRQPNTVGGGSRTNENGLSFDYSNNGITENEWGRVTSKQYLTKFFENNSSSRRNQDVGFDGLKNEDEINYFKTNFIDNLNLTSEAKLNIELDVSADNFKYYLGNEFDQSNKKLLKDIRIIMEWKAIPLYHQIAVMLLRVHRILKMKI